MPELQPTDRWSRACRDAGAVPDFRETVVASHARILLIDADIQSRAWLHRTLAREGRDLWFAGSCAEARALNQRSPGPDIAVVAAELPDGCGLDLIAELRKVTSTCECLAIATRPTVEGAARAMRLGAADYLIKPLSDERAMRNSVDWALARAAAHQMRDLEGQRLEESEERYALALEATKDGLWDWDLEKNCLYLSRRWKQILGFEDSEVGTSPDEWFSRVHPKDLSEVQARVAGRHSDSMGHFEIDYRMLTKYGSYVWVRTRGVAVRDAHRRTKRIAGILSDISRAKLIESRLVHEALHDNLTRLANRVSFHQRLLEAIEKHGKGPGRRDVASFAVLFVDLDRFKNVNDSLGHQAGDQLLLEVARRLQASVRGTDHVARLGGDEFAILISDATDMMDLAPILRRIENSMSGPCQIQGHSIVPSASIGIAFGFGHCTSPEEILRNADIAMYRAKDLGRGRAEVFDEHMHVKAMDNFRLEADLRLALESDQLEVHYQPIFDLCGNTLSGFEALVRWNHEERGWISPEQFVSVAEECALIVPLGRWVLRTACEQLAIWQQRAGRPLWMSINLSPKQVFDPGIVGMISETLAEFRIEAESVKLEVTEGVFVDRIDMATFVLDQLKALGVQLCLDDFGTGYSSLSYLSQLPFDVLKIDRSFVMGMAGEKSSLVQAIVTMGQALGIQVVAEGIEEAYQCETLREFGCDFGQGYLFSPPLSSTAAGELVEGLNQSSMSA